MDETTSISSTVITQTSSKTTEKPKTSPQVPPNLTKSSTTSTKKPEISSKRPNHSTNESPFGTTEITETSSIETSSSESTTQDVGVPEIKSTKSTTTEKIYKVTLQTQSTPKVRLLIKIGYTRSILYNIIFLSFFSAETRSKSCPNINLEIRLFYKPCPNYTNPVLERHRF